MQIVSVFADEDVEKEPRADFAMAFPRSSLVVAADRLLVGSWDAVHG